MTEFDDKKVPEPKDPRKITTTTLVIWVVVGAFALYLIGTGLVGILSK